MKTQAVITHSYQTVVNGQVVTVHRYAPTVADAKSRDTSELSFYRNKRSRLNHSPIKQYLRR